MSLILEGEVAARREFSDADLAALPGQENVAEKIPGKDGRGVRLRSILDAAKTSSRAKWATLASTDGFAICVPLDAIAGNALVAYGIPESKGGPMRFYVIDVAACGTAEVDACANVKKLARITLTSERVPDVGHDHTKK